MDFTVSSVSVTGDKHVFHCIHKHTCSIGALPRICTFIQLSVNIYCGSFCTRFVPVVCTYVDSLVSRVGAT